MSTIFIREIRENLKWAVLIFAITGGFAFYHVWLGFENVLFELGDVLKPLAPLAGLLIGVIQSLFETQPDNWAFVVHRPVSRSAIFISKCGAGLFLLLTSLAVPCLALAIWSSRPGAQATPFDWRMALPAAAQVLVATLWYFAGIVLVLRRALWYGSRVAPVGLAALVSICVLQVSEFGTAVAVAVAALPVMALAAWGAFAAGGGVVRGRAARFALGTALYAGCLVSFVVVVALAGWFDATHQESDFWVDRDGRILQAITRRAGVTQSFSVLDLQGNSVREYEGSEADSVAALDRLIKHWATLFDDRKINWPTMPKVLGYRNLNSLMLPLNKGGGSNFERGDPAWFRRASNVIELYDHGTRRLIGAIGPGGFVPTDHGAADSFPGTPLNVLNQSRNRTLAFSTAVYWLELDRRRARQVFTAVAGDPVISAGELRRPGQKPCALVMTERRLHLIDPETGQTTSVELALNHQTYGVVSVTILPTNGDLFVLAWPPESDQSRTFPPKCFEIALDGKLVRDLDLPMPSADKAMGKTQAMVAGLLSPLAGIIASRSRQSFGFAQRIGTNWEWFWESLLGSAFVCAITAVMLSNCYGFSRGRMVAWALTNLLLGPGGVIVLVSLNEWQIRERCSACGKARLIEQVDCPRCRTPRPRAEFDGREIFEPFEVSS